MQGPNPTDVRDVRLPKRENVIQRGRGIIDDVLRNGSFAIVGEDVETSLKKGGIRSHETVEGHDTGLTQLTADPDGIARFRKRNRRRWHRCP